MTMTSDYRRYVGKDDTALLNITMPCTDATHRGTCGWQYDSVDDINGTISREHTVVDASGLEISWWEFPPGDARNDDLEETEREIHIPHSPISGLNDYRISEAVKIYAALGRLLAASGGFTGGAQAEIVPPAWHEGSVEFDRGCVYADRRVVRDGVTATLDQTDELLYDEETRTYSVVRQPATISIPGGFDGQVLTIEEARAMITGPTDDPTVLAIAELLAAYDCAAATA
ncbi:hypothetical protein SAMN04515671_0075 [Nakamurella panacisegetis]|uniref:Uncharacterized protein n=1 Tax=Nakamurella panacisegetis TaxID=1090615 RepID=A0A1H0HHH1_9ACTN|nr:hypothetical protein [Nakamurella panacisegetis]SDO18612.1 hypothetical protein SAMN04515671_0075 [Nakamurella panacisegetis]